MGNRVDTELNEDYNPAMRPVAAYKATRRSRVVPILIERFGSVRAAVQVFKERFRIDGHDVPALRHQMLRRTPSLDWLRITRDAINQCQPETFQPVTLEDLFEEVAEPND